MPESFVFFRGFILRSPKRMPSLSFKLLQSLFDKRLTTKGWAFGIIFA